MKLQLSLLPEHFSIHRLSADTEIADLPPMDGFFSIARTDDELSLVCSAQINIHAAKTEPGWRCLKVAGPLDFGLTGVLAEISSVLANSEISLFAISTYDTDYILVKGDTLDEAISALAIAGHDVG